MLMLNQDVKENKKQLKKFESARKDYIIIERKIAPFIKKRRVDKGYSTAGEWCNNTDLCFK